MKIAILCSVVFFQVLSIARADYADELIQSARAKNLAAHAQWHNLLHYQTRLFGGYKSQGDGAEFFFAPDGRTNPDTELEATIRAFFATDPKLMSDGEIRTGRETPRGPQHPQCAFPARFLFVKRALGVDLAKLPAPRCERFRNFRDTIGAKSATVVFSSYYLNNPASAFGHSFLRLNKTEVAHEGPRYELLDYGFNYAALATSNNALVYALSGVFGFFPGTFTSVPYYHKVREYNDYESRDLWEYDLNLTRDQIDVIVAHAWELGHARFDYYYLDENCSYHVLTLLDAAAPELDLARRLGPIVIPADTIKILADTPGLIRDIHFRPSGRMQFQKRLGQLTTEQTTYLKQITRAEGESPVAAPASFDSQQTVGVLDAAIDYVDFRFNKDLAKSDSLAAQWKQKLLLARSKIMVPSPKLSVEAPHYEMPHLGHDSRRLSADYGYGKQTESYTRLNLRYALHDLLDPTSGYPGYAQMEIFNARLRYNHKPRTLWLEDFALLQVTSLSSLSSFNRSLSWRMKLGARTVRDRSCENCLAGNLLIGAGYSVEPFSSFPISLFGMLEADVAGAPEFDRAPVRPGFGPTLGLRIPVTRRWFSLAHASYRHQFPTHHPHYLELGFESRFALVKDFALNAKWIRYPVAQEFSFGGLYYF